MYDLDVKPEADEIFRKLAKKNKKQLEIVYKKLQEIQSNPDHIYKFLMKPLQTFQRVHIDNHFVLIFKIDHCNHVVDVYYFSHHDTIYKWRPQSKT